MTHARPAARSQHFGTVPPVGPRTHLIGLLDLDCFFVSAQRSVDRELLSRPVAVARNHPRAVVASASYEARARGVRTGMPLGRARALCSDLWVVAPDRQMYEHLAGEVARVLANRVCVMSRVGLDEWYFAVCTSSDGHGFAVGLRSAIRCATGLPASVGIAPFTSVAKLACRPAKPDGQVVLHHADLAGFLAARPLADLPGVGPVLADRLAGVEMVDQLTPAAVTQLGRSTRSLLCAYALLAGETPAWADDLDLVGAGELHRAWSRVVFPSPARSVSAECTFHEDLEDLDELRDHLHRLCVRLSGQLETSGSTAGAVVLKLRDPAMGDRTRTIRLHPASRHPEELYQAALEALCALGGEDLGAVRLAGITASALHDARQPDLFGMLSPQPTAPLHPGIVVRHSIHGPGLIFDVFDTAVLVRFSDRSRLLPHSVLVPQEQRLSAWCDEAAPWQIRT